MATFVGNTVDGQIIVVAWVSVSGEAGIAPKAYGALLDTGAQTSMISQKVVEGVGLMAIGHINIIPVTGQATPTEKYRIRLDIPITSGIALPSGDQLLERRALVAFADGGGAVGVEKSFQWTHRCGPNSKGT